MTPQTKDKLGAVALGALGGGVVAFLGWQYFSSQVDREVTATIDREVGAELDRKLGELGITPQVAANIRTLVQNLDQLGVLSALAQGTTPR